MFFDILQARCEQLNIKLTPLLNELNLSKGSISRWKAGTLPNGETLLKLASRLDCSVDYLLGLEESPQPPIESVSIHVDENGVEETREQIIKIVDQMTPEEQTAYLDVLLTLLHLKGHSLQPKRQSVGA